MYKILIVDDFEADRDIMREMIGSFKDLELEVCGECSNGLEALEAARRQKPDIILSDIEMPIMNGFQLARNIRKELRDTRLIFCSMYSEFKYAKEALYLESYGYVLKPIDPLELKECICKVTGRIMENSMIQKENENLRSILEENKPVIIESLIKDIIYGMNKNSPDIWEKVEYYGIPLQKGVFLLGFVEIDDYYEITEQLTIEKRQILSMRVYKKIRDFQSDSICSFTTKVDDSHFLIIFSAPPGRPAELVTDSVGEFCERVVADFLNTDISVTMSISSECTRIEEVSSLLEQCMYLMRLKYSLGKGKVIYNSDVPSSTAKTNVDFNEMMKEIRFLLNSGNKKEIEDYIYEIFDKAPANAGMQHFKNICFCVIICVQVVVYEQNESFKEIFDDENLLWEKLMRFETIVDSKNWLYNTLLFVNEYLSAKAASREEAIVRRIKESIEKNLLSDISLASLAHELYYSPNYLNLIFRKSTGGTIFDYIVGCRVKKAMEMLTDPKLKLYEIAEKLGYSHTAYFSNVFKKYAGLSPKEYRERLS